MDITVITPFYKGNAYMEQLLGCIRRNAAAAPDLTIELLLVNDSPDCQVCYDRDWVEGFTLRVITNEVNSGIHRSRVNGLLQAKGQFIQFLDQDDLLADETLVTQFPLIQDADVVIANGFDQNPKTYGPIYKSLRHQQQATHSHFYFALGDQIVSPGQCLIRKASVPKIWCEDSIRRNGADDLLLWLLMFSENRKFVINPRQLYTHVETGKNVSGDEKKLLGSSWEVLEYLISHQRITPRQERLFRRSRSMAMLHANKSRWHKIPALLRYPDVAWQKLRLMSHRYKK